MSSGAPSRRCMGAAVRSAWELATSMARWLHAEQQEVLHAQKRPGRHAAPPWPVCSDRSFRIVQTVLRLCIGFVISATDVRQILQREAIGGWQITLLDAAEENDLAGNDFGA